MSYFPTMIEFFSGSKVMSQTFKDAGYKVFTVDFNKKLNPDLAINILDFDIDMLPKKFRNPKIIWASPPCTTFSVSSIGHYWRLGKPSNHKTYIGLAIAKKTLEIIEQLKPKYFFIENPVGMLRNQHFLANIHRTTVTYCQYGENRRKPTDIWHNSEWIPRKQCNNGDNCHEASPRGKTGGTQALANNFERSKIPLELCKEILTVCEDKQQIKQTRLF